MRQHGVIPAGNHLHANLAAGAELLVHSDASVVTVFVRRCHRRVVVRDADELRARAEQPFFAEKHSELLPSLPDFIVRSDVAHESDTHGFQILDGNVHGLVLELRDPETSRPLSLMVMHAGGDLNPRTYAVTRAKLHRRQTERLAKGAAKRFVSFISRLEGDLHDRRFGELEPRGSA